MEVELNTIPKAIQVIRRFMYWEIKNLMSNRSNQIIEQLNKQGHGCQITAFNSNNDK